MYPETHGPEVPKDEDATIWRYCDLVGFMSLLQRQALFFARADRLGDPFEGSLPTRNVEQRRAELVELEIPEEAHGSFGEIYQMMPLFTFVNCWHMNDSESAAMWQLYADRGKGIAIRSTFARLKRSLGQASEPVELGLVQYIDYAEGSIDWEDDSITDLGRLVFMHKRRSFAHEKELRAIHSRPATLYRDEDGKVAVDVQKGLRRDGVSVPVELSTLIERVYVAPQQDDWRYEAVKALAVKYGLSAEVVRSDLDRDPVF